MSNENENEFLRALVAGMPDVQRDAADRVTGLLEDAGVPGGMTGWSSSSELLLAYGAAHSRWTWDLRIVIDAHGGIAYRRDGLGCGESAMPWKYRGLSAVQAVDLLRLDLAAIADAGRGET